MKYSVPQVLASVVSVMVVTAVVAGFIVAGSPALERARRFDDQRVNALGQIANAVGIYVENRRAVPATLADLETAASKGFGVYLPDLKDPATQAIYEYAATGPIAYRLCATFQAEPRPVDPNNDQYVGLKMGGTPDFSRHASGHQCWDVDLTERAAKAQTTAPAPVPGMVGANGTVVPTPVVPTPVAPAPALVTKPASPAPTVTEKPVDECTLMQNPKDGTIACSGCANGVCHYSPNFWNLYKPGETGIPYACYAGPKGCELAQ
jgi:hypothetical protein